jgi:hypothetical protein
MSRLFSLFKFGGNWNVPRIALSTFAASLWHTQQGKEAEHLQTEINEMELDRKQDQEDDIGVTPACSKTL